MPTLFIASGTLEGRWFPIQKKSLIIGRDDGLIAQIADPGISRKHLSISYNEADNSYTVTDLKSKNGVFHNNVLLRGSAPLKDDDLLRIGDTLLLFSAQDFTGDDNALNHYRKRGERVKETLRLQGQTAQIALETLRKLEDNERSKKKTK